MKKLLYSGLAALMMLFAVGSANAQSVRVSWSGAENTGLTWTMNEAAPTFTVTVTGDESNSLVWGENEGNVALEIKLVFDDSYGGDGEDVTQVFTSITGSLTLDVDDLVGGDYDVRYRLVKGDDQNTKFDGATVSGDVLYFTVVDPNAAPYVLQSFSALTQEPLSEEDENPATLYYPFVSFMAYTTEMQPMTGDFYYAFGNESAEAVEPTREAYNAADNNGKVRKAAMMSMYGMEVPQIYAEEAGATSIKVKAYLTPMSMGDLDEGLRVQADEESEEIVTKTYTYSLSFLESATCDPVFTPADGEIESGESVKLSVENVKISGEDIEAEENIQIFYSLNGKTPLYNYGSVDNTSGIFEYTEDGIAINGKAGDEVTVKAIVYVMDEDWMYHASQIITTTYTIKSDEKPADQGTLTVTPDGTTAVEEGDEVTFAVETEYVGYRVMYHWYADMAEAEADNSFKSYADGGSEIMEDTKLTISKDKPVLGIGVANGVVEDEFAWVIAPKYFTYTFAGGETPDPDDVTAPTIDKEAGAYASGTVVTVSKGEADSIFVATGKTIAEATAFVKATADVTVTLTADTVIRAYAMKGGERSDTVSRTYTIQAGEDPEVTITLSPVSGTEVEEGDTVKITCSDETAVVYFMMFDTKANAEAISEEDWTDAMIEYGEPVEDDEFIGYPVITKEKPVIKVGYAIVDEEENFTWYFTYAEYTVKGGETPVTTVAKPTFSVEAGAVEKGTKVVLDCTTEGAKIYYTVNGEEPTAESTEYTAEISIDSAMTIKAIAVKEGLENSEVAEAAYTIKPVANQTNELAGVSIYPNPTDGEFNVVAPVNAEVEIFNAAGVIVKRTVVAEGMIQVRLNNSGIYFVRVRANGQAAIKKVVIR